MTTVELTGHSCSICGYAEPTGVVVCQVHTFQKLFRSQALVAHACNPSYSGGRDQKD
jgi:hypothetical protein